jgi:riboflavin synthase
MFTGLVQGVGVVGESRPTAAGIRLLVDPRDWPHRPLPGESIAVSGVCLTLAAPVGPDRQLAFDVVAETLARTTLGRLAPSSRVNLERSLAVGDLLGGHFVQGHVDGVGVVERVETGGDRRVRIRPPAELMPCIAPKGSVTVEGVSLTVAAADGEGGAFEVALIPTTLALTTLDDLRPGAAVNIETDVLARTVVHYIRHRAP